MIAQVRDRLAEAGVRFDAMLVDLRREPRLQVVHERPAVRLVKREPLVRGEPLRPRVGVVAIHLAQRLEHVATLGRKTRRDLHKPAPRVRETIPEDHRQRLRQIPREGIAHLDRRPELGRPRGEHVREIFARVPAAGQKERDALPLPRRDDPGRKDPRPVGREVVVGRRGDPGRSRSSTVMRVSSLCSSSPCAACRVSSASAGCSRVAVSATISHWVEAGSGICRFAWSRSSRWKGIPLPYFRSGDHRAGGRIVLLGAHPRRRIGREELAAEMTAQFLQRVDRRGDGRLADEPDEHARVPLAIHLAGRARRTPIPVVQLRVGDRDVPGAGVHPRRLSPTLKKRRNLDRLSTDGSAAPLTGRPAASSV